MTDRDAPRAMEALEQRGDEFGDVPTAPAPLRAVRSWRAGDQRTGTAPVALGSDQHTRASAHLSGGRPDPRRNDLVPAGNPAAPESPYVAGREDRTNVRELVQLEPTAPPTRPRAGFTGADPTRAARFVRAYLLRPFDQNMAQHPGAVDKAGQPNPTAARPPQRGRLIGGLPSATGTEGTRTAGIGPQRNTYRIVPGAWDEKIVNPGNAAAPSSRRARGWRL